MMTYKKKKHMYLLLATDLSSYKC